MERSYRNRIMKKFKTFQSSKRIVVLNIPDEYEFMDPEFVRLGQAGVITRPGSANIVLI